MAKTQILEYTIWLTDEATVNDLNAQLDAGTGPGEIVQYWSPSLQAITYGISRAPYNPGPPPGGAAIEFNAPLIKQGDPFAAPCIASLWFTGGNNFPTDVAVFNRCNGGWFGICSLFGTTTVYRWVGRFKYAPSKDPDAPPPVPPAGPHEEFPQAISSRIWVNGFELLGGEIPLGVGTQQTGKLSRDASRDYQGLGFAFRTSAASSFVEQAPAGGTINGVRQRFYLRVRSLPSSYIWIWWSKNAATSGSGHRLRLNSSGDIVLYESSGSGESSVVARGTVGTAVVGQWHRIDTIERYITRLVPQVSPNVPLEIPSTTVKVYFDRTLGSSNAFDSGGTAANSRFTESVLGCSFSLSDYTEVDFDNWIGVELPDIASWRVSDTFAVFIGVELVWSGTPKSYAVGDEVVATVINARPVTIANADPDAKNIYVCTVAHTGDVDDPASTFPPDHPELWGKVVSPVDWHHGSKVVRVVPSGDGGDRADWAGDWQLALQVPLYGGNIDFSGNSIVSTTSGALLELATDIVEKVNNLHGSLGAVAAAIGMHGWRGSSSGSLGATATFDDDDTDAVDTAIVQSAVNDPTWNGVIHSFNAGQSTPKDLKSYLLQHTKGADTGSSSIYSLQASVEVVGQFGAEDGSGAADVKTGSSSIHNSYYSRSPWSEASLPFAPAARIGGTYTGTGAAKYLVLPLPVHWLRVRRVTGTGDTGVGWWTTMFSSHADMALGVYPHYIVDARDDPGFPVPTIEDEQEMQFLVLIPGDDAQVNANGVTYQYIALCDPAARYLLNGAFSHNSTGATFPKSEALADQVFTPVAGFFQFEEVENVTGDSLFYKGPDHATSAASKIAATSAIQSSFATFAQGQLGVESAANPTGVSLQQTAYSLFRNDDGNGVASFFQTATYTGDGVSPRTIDLTPTSLLRPMFAIVTGTGATTRHHSKDPSNTSANSTVLSTGTEAADGIVGGGVDQIIVESVLNVSDVVYHVFVIPGSATGLADGWSQNTAGTDEQFVGEPDSPMDIGWIEPVIVTHDTDLTDFVDTEPALVAFDISDEDSISGLSAEGVVTNLCNYILHRLGDSEEGIWNHAEMKTYLVMAATEMAQRTRIIWDRFHVDDILELTGQSSDPPPVSFTLHRPVTEIDRAVWQNRMIEAFTPGDFKYTDTRYEITTGEPIGYTWQKDGVRVMRVVRPPATNPLEIRVDHWRHFEVDCSLSELPPRYFLYLGDYMQNKALVRHGPGQDYKLAQLFKDRWERGISRIIGRVNRQNRTRVGRLGGSSTSMRPGPPRPRLPWPYGSKVR